MFDFPVSIDTKKEKAAFTGKRFGFYFDFLINAAVIPYPYREQLHDIISIFRGVLYRCENLYLTLRLFNKSAILSIPQICPQEFKNPRRHL